MLMQRSLLGGNCIKMLWRCSPWDAFSLCNPKVIESLPMGGSSSFNHVHIATNTTCDHSWESGFTTSYNLGRETAKQIYFLLFNSITFEQCQGYMESGMHEKTVVLQAIFLRQISIGSKLQTRHHGLVLAVDTDIEPKCHANLGFIERIILKISLSGDFLLKERSTARAFCSSIAKEWEGAENLQGVLAYQTRYSKFQSVASITLHFPENFGGDTTQIHYIGLKGEATQRDVVATIVYEITPNPSDHKTKAEHGGGFSHVE
ncbi:hypothetical protein ACOSP7_008424 [Xanthoceras sorbifolium]